METKDLNVKTESKELGALLLDIGLSLLQAEANSGRIRITMSRLAALYHYLPHITIGAKSVALVLNDRDGNTLFNGARSTSLHGINFSVISEISRFSWMAAEKRLPVNELRKELSKSQAMGHHPRIIILCFVSLAGAAFCYIFGGGYIEMSITFGATFCGLFAKQQLAKSKINPYTCTYAAATIASLFTGFFHVTGLTVSPESAFSTCVLFL